MLPLFVFSLQGKLEFSITSGNEAVDAGGKKLWTINNATGVVSWNADQAVADHETQVWR